MTALDTSAMNSATLALVSGGIAFVGLYHGIENGLLAGGCSIVMGPDYLDIFSNPPVLVSVIPASCGAIFTAMTRNSEHPAWFALYGVFFTLGALLGASLMGTPKLLFFLWLGLALLRLLFSKY